jgi:phosphate transport system ATP-binding protein
MTEPVADLTPEIAEARDVDPAAATVFSMERVTFRYGSTVAFHDVSLDIRQNEITAIIGPSGCGKSTLIRCFNRMNDLIPGASLEGTVRFHGEDMYERGVDAVDLRRRVGMVFQKPNPFPKSIKDNITFGMRINGIRPTMERVERALRAAALWDEVKDVLNRDAYTLSGGQQQRLCIARTIAVEPEVILMDEPASALDPVATLKIEDLMRELRERYTIVIVTHNMQQAARASDRTAFMTVVGTAETERSGTLAEFGLTEQIFQAPRDQRTQDYITGRFG